MSTYGSGQQAYVIVFLIPGIPTLVNRIEREKKNEIDFVRTFFFFFLWRIIIAWRCKCKCHVPFAVSKLLKINFAWHWFSIWEFRMFCYKVSRFWMQQKIITRHLPIPIHQSRINIKSNAIKNKFNLPIRNHSPFVIKLEMSPPSSDFNTKSSCFVQIKHHRQGKAEKVNVSAEKQKENILFSS